MINLACWVMLIFWCSVYTAKVLANLTFLRFFLTEIFFRRKKETFVFSFIYRKVEDCLSQVIIIFFQDVVFTFFWRGEGRRRAVLEWKERKIGEKNPLSETFDPIIVFPSSEIKNSWLTLNWCKGRDVYFLEKLLLPLHLRNPFFEIMYMWFLFAKLGKIKGWKKTCLLMSIFQFLPKLLKKCTIVNINPALCVKGNVVCWKYKPGPCL